MKRFYSYDYDETLRWKGAYYDLKREYLDLERDFNVYLTTALIVIVAMAINIILNAI